MSKKSVLSTCYLVKPINTRLAGNDDNRVKKL